MQCSPMISCKSIYIPLSQLGDWNFYNSWILLRFPWFLFMVISASVCVYLVLYILYRFVYSYHCHNSEQFYHYKDFSCFPLTPTPALLLPYPTSMPNPCQSLFFSPFPKCWWGCRKTRSLLHCWWDCKMIQPL